jgi:lipopolysaccharide/colanic/teichoic acid biosynthesis glycosyltransferase
MTSGGTHATTLAPAVEVTVQAAPPRVAETRVTAVACRVLDIVGAALLLIVLSPLLAAIAVAIRLDSPGAPLFRQRRLGRDLIPFTVNKFRTMHAGVGHDVHRDYVLGLITKEAEEPGSGGALFKLSADRRVTRLGRYLRKSSLDELPQLWNVLIGDMSLVGPRPSLPYEVERYPSHWFLRFSVKPGMTGLWQISGRSELTWEQMILLDEEYVRTRSFWTNVSILLRTVPVVVRARGAA